MRRSIVSSEDDLASPPRAAKKLHRDRKVVSSSDEDVLHGVDYDADAVDVGPVPAQDDVVQYLMPTKRKDPRLKATPESVSDSDDDVPLFEKKIGTEMLDLKGGGPNL